MKRCIDAHVNWRIQVTCELHAFIFVPKLELRSHGWGCVDDNFALAVLVMFGRIANVPQRFDSYGLRGKNRTQTAAGRARPTQLRTKIFADTFACKFE